MKTAIIVLATIWVVVALPLEILTFLYAGHFVAPRLSPTSSAPMHIFSWLTELLFFIIPMIIGALVLMRRSGMRRREKDELR